MKRSGRFGAWPKGMISKRVIRHESKKKTKGAGVEIEELVFRFDGVVIVLEWVLPQDLSF